MNNDSKDNVNETDAEEAIWQHNEKIGGLEHANKVVHKHRAKIMAAYIALAVAAVAVAVIVESVGASHWITGAFGSIATLSMYLVFFSVRDTVISPARRHDPKVQQYRKWLELDIIERERQKSQMSDEERAELQMAEIAYYDSGAGKPQTGIGMFTKD